MRAESAAPLTPSSTGLARAVHEQALRTPRADALVDGDVRLDYTGLVDAAAAVAHGLRLAGVRPGQAVAVCLPRSWQLVCVMLGVLRLGAQVVPLDAQSPARRRDHILADSGSVALVHGGTAPDGLPDRVRPLEAAELLAAGPGDREAVPTGAPVSFVFYTSGTTGRPKGVEVRDAGILRLAEPGYIRIEEGARYSCLSNPAFDALSFEVWVPLLTGGCCVVLGDEAVQTPHRLAAALLRERIDTTFVTVALFNAVVDTEPSCFAGVGQLLVGGEQLNARAIRRWYRHNAAAPTLLHNVYGPTEATTFALCHPIPRDFDGDLVPIGRALPRTGAVLVAPDGDRAAAPGEVAELHLAGAALAAGYRNLPEETRRRFVRLPWYDGGRTIHYRTGDLVRADADGPIEYVGRADRQVKVRGFRIEPGELERQILAHPAVRQAYVCTRRAGEHGPNELLAYVVLGEEVPFEEFDRHLAARLPGYMRPHHIHLVDELPLNANGKVDRDALLRREHRPWRGADGGRPAATATTARQREVLDLAAEVLGVADPRLEDRWIAVGGDSLKALRLRFEVRRRWGRELSQASVLAGDLAGIARAVAEGGSAAESPYPVPAAPTRARSAAATSEQQRLWLLQQRAPRSRSYAVELAFRLDGTVDAEALRGSLRALVRRHAALRTAFEAAPEGLRQLVGDPYDPWVEPGPAAGDAPQPVDSEGGAGGAEDDARAKANRFFAVPFDLSSPRMLRARWLPQDGGGVLLLHLHHIAVDGWSLNVLLDDLSTGYRHAHDGTAEPSPHTDTAPAPTPLDFAAWQSDWFADPAYLAQRSELRAHYARTDEAQDHDPAARAEARPGPRAHLLATSLDVVRRAAVDRLCAELGMTRFELLLGVFTWSLYGVTGGTRPRIAAPVANRPVQEFERSVGMFANTVLLPQAVAPREALRGQLLRLVADARQVMERQDVALADVLADRDTAGGETPFDYLFVLENTDFGALALPGCASRPLWWAPAEAKCPMTLSVVEHGGGLDCLWEYAEDRFDAAEVTAAAGLFRRGLDLLAEGGTATPAELVAPYRRGLPEPGRGASTAPAWTTVAEGFARQVARTPDAPALVSDGRTVSYAELDAHAAAFAAELRAAHPLPERADSPCRVALHLRPSVEHVVALLALARLNVTAVPLDPSYPPALRRQVLDQAEPLCVLLPPGGDPEFDAVDPGRVARHPVVLAPGAPVAAPAALVVPAAPPAPAHGGARPLYTLFTSGSTGVPKGVQVSDRTLCNLLQWQADSGGLAAPAATQQFSMLSFDVSFQEVFGTLCGGGRLHLVRPDWRQDAPALLEQLETAGVERVFMPYVALQLLAEHGVQLGRYPSRLREVVTAGEQLVCTEAIRRWFAGLPGARLYNHYGPTETHVVSSLRLDGDPARWPERPAIGRPVDNAVLTVVDEADQPVPPGRAGALLIGGAMAARCYLGDPALDEARFVELPGLGLCYRSGDRARFDRQGLLHYLGRDDDQIKLSGHRLELGQVEAALLRHPDVVNAVVVRDGEELVACLQCREEAPTVEDLTAHLAPMLPGHVRIARFRVVGELPRMPSGKLDRRGALRSAGRELRRPTARGTALSAREARLTEVFEAVTGLAIDPAQTFFQAGASSLGLMRFQLRCSAEPGLRFTVADLFEHVTVRALAAFLDRAGAPSAVGAPAVGAPSVGAVPTAGDGPIAVDEPIAVVGMAVRLPGASDLSAFWRMVTAGGTGIEHFDAADGLVGARSQLDGPLDFDPDHFGISRQEARLMDPQQRHLLMSCVEALAHAGIADPSGARVGLVAGAGENTYFQSMLREADPERLPDGFQLALHHDKDFLATKAAYHLGLTGPAFTTQAACASSLVAVHVAAGLLRQGDAEVMLAGGVLVDPTLTGGYRYQPQHIFSVDGLCRPFSDDASGTIGASGVGTVVLKPLRLARRDGDTVYALITGSALNNDGSDKLSYSAPSLAGQREVIRAALRRSGRGGADLGYVEAHGTGTRLGDPVEVGALRQAFDLDRSGHCALTSVKSQIGHLGAAAGVVGLVRAALAVHHGVIPPNVGFRALNPRLGPDPAPFYIPTEARPWPADRARIAAVSSFGIGGTNAHAVLEADRPAPAAPGGAAPTAADATPDPSVPPCLLLSSSSEAGLRADAARIADYLEARPTAYPQVLRHLQAGRPARRYRLAAVCPDAAAAVARLRAVGPVTDAGAEEARTGAPVPGNGRTAEETAAAWLSGERIDWPAGPAQAPWDFPPPAFALAEFDFPRATAAPAPAQTAVHVPAQAQAQAPAGPVAADVPRRLPEDAWLHQPHWARLRRAGSAVGVRGSRLLVLLTDGPAHPEVVRAVEAAYARVVRVRAAEAFARRGEDLYEVDPADPSSLGRLLDALAGTGAGEDGIDWLHALPLGIDGPVGRDSLDRARWACLDTPAALLRAVAEAEPAGSLRLTPWWLSYRARPVDGPVGRPEAGLLAGPVEVAPQEGAAAGHWVDLPDADPAHWAVPLAALLAEAATAPDRAALPRRLALRRGHWWEQVALPVAPAGPSPVGLPDGGVHLVLGGTGGIGRSIAAWLLENGCARVLLLARNPRLPEELTAWADRVELVEADLAETAPEEVLARIDRLTDRVDGVIHAAGVASGGLIARRDAGAMARASAAKLRGALLVERLIERHRPSVAVYCSSMAAELGGVGQLDYAAANSLLDGFAQYRADDAETTVRLGVNWDVWSEAGMALRAPLADSRHRAHLSVGLTVAEGTRVFARAMGLRLPQVLVSTTDLRESRAFYAAPEAPALVPTAPAAPPASTAPVASVPTVSVPTASVSTASVSAGDPTAADAVGGDAAVLLRDWLCDWLDLDHLDPDAPLYDLGVDSLTLLDLIGVVKRHFDVELELSRLSHRVCLTEILARLSEAAPGRAVVTEGVVPETWQHGTGDDVLCLVHPVGGDIQAYRSLVSALDPRLTVCLIADPALERPGTADWTLAERAHRYAAALRARFPDDTRRLHLAGWSFGAWAVMGMAAQAEAIGRPVHGVHLIDPPPPGAGELYRDHDDARLQAVFAHELGQGGAAAAGPEAQGYAERLVRCCRANLRSMAGYRMPLLSATPSRIWLAERPVEGLPAPVPPERQRELWRPHLPEPSTWHRLDTTHYGIVRPPHAHAVAAAINAAVTDAAVTDAAVTDPAVTDPASDDTARGRGGRPGA